MGAIELQPLAILRGYNEETIAEVDFQIRNIFRGRVNNAKTRVRVKAEPSGVVKKKEQSKRGKLAR